MNNNSDSTQFHKSIQDFSVKKLPLEIRQRLLKIQNEEGNYIKRKIPGMGCFAVVSGFVLFVWLNLFLFSVSFLYEKDFVIVVYFVTFFVFLFCSFFLVNIIESVRSPIKDSVFILPTQIIITQGDLIRTANLIDTVKAEYVLIKTRRQGGRTNYSCEFKLYFPADQSISFSIESEGEYNEINNRINQWNSETRRIINEGNHNFVENNNVFRGLDKSDPTSYAFKSGCFRQLLTGLLGSFLATTFIVPGAAVIVFYKKDQADWNMTVSKNGITDYRIYIQTHPWGRHRDEAKLKLEGFYEAESQQLKNQIKNGTDPQSVEVLIQLLESAKEKGKAGIKIFCERETKIPNDLDLKLSRKVKTNNIFPLKDIYSFTESKLKAEEKTLLENLKKTFDSNFPEGSLFLVNVNESEVKPRADEPIIKIKYSVELNETDPPQFIKAKDNSIVYFHTVIINFECIVLNPGKPEYKYNLKVNPSVDFGVYSKTDTSFYSFLLRTGFRDFEADFKKRFGSK